MYKRPKRKRRVRLYQASGKEGAAVRHRHALYACGLQFLALPVRIHARTRLIVALAAWCIVWGHLFFFSSEAPKGFKFG